MQLKSTIKALGGQISDLNGQEKKHFLILSLVMFSLLFSYPMVRSTTTVFFIESAGAANSPWVWIFSVIALVIMVAIKNYWQTKISSHSMFTSIVFFTLVVMSFGIWFYREGSVSATYLMYVCKEVYIVLCVHMILGYLNASMTTTQAKLFYGPLGAIGSLGGIFGGLVTSTLVVYTSPMTILILGLSLLIVAAVAFNFSDHQYNLHLKAESKEMSPLRSIRDVKLYVSLIIGIIVISQFCINIANFKFNLLFEVLVKGTEAKTAYLGGLYSLINLCSLLIQFLAVPFIFHRFKMTQIHLGIPLAFVASSAFMLIGGSPVLSLVAGGFLLMKALDYSLLSAAKELLYFPLSVHQKFGAKYLGDMVFYRLAKGLISAILLFFTSHTAINILLGLSLLIWGLLAFALSRVSRSIKENL